MSDPKSSFSFSEDRERPWGPRLKGIDATIDSWKEGGVYDCMALDHTTEPKLAQSVPFPSELSENVKNALKKRGIQELYAHQARAFELGRSGKSFVVATPTASGKSLCYNLPILDRLSRDPDARALFLYPTKALSRDQEDALRGMLSEAGLKHGAITFDGDTPGDARKVARQRSGLILTNPDMLHSGILPHHTSWARLFSNLRFVVIDELHAYRGVFGSHLANVLRRLRRICHFHGSDPTFIAASATIGNPREHASKILGKPAEVISESGAPSGARRIMLYNPPVINPELGVRASYIKSAVRLAEDLVRANVSTLVFGQSRNSVEVMLKYLRDRLKKDAGFDPDWVHAYRGGYLPNQRREIERRLRQGDIRCVVATNALELGIDIGALDAVVCAGYPGSLAGTMQRFGRAGRREEPAVGIMVASSMPLDQFVARAPEQLITAPIEHARIDPNNPEILIQHLKCGSFELPFELSESESFGDLPKDELEAALGFLADHGVVHPEPNADGETVFHWATDAYPANAVSLRSVGWDNYVIIDVEGDRLLAEMDWRSVHTQLHEQAIYQHSAEQYQVERLDYENHKAYVRKVVPDYYTTAMKHTKVTILDEDKDAVVGTRENILVGYGDISVVQKVVGYKKIKFHTHENVGYGDVHLPAMQMHTMSVWMTFPEVVLEEFMRQHSIDRPRVIDALRGLLRAMHVVGAISLMVDPRDLGTALEDQNGQGGPSTGEKEPGARFDPTLFVYDQIPGGVGLASRLFEERESLLIRARRSIESCSCISGCPACIGPSADASPELDLKRRNLTTSLLDFVGIGIVH